MTNYVYDQKFYEGQSHRSWMSARKICSRVRSSLPHVSSVLDIGCGSGSWLRAWLDLGIIDVHGLDGSYVFNSKLMIPKELISAQNLNERFSLERKFDLVTCLEVAEHLSPSNSKILVETICRHGDLVLFSAAVPGQGGENHVNERTYEYWRQLFEESGYSMFDFVRPWIQADKEIEVWYRRNVFLYAKKRVMQELPSEILKTQVPLSHSIHDYSSIPEKLRKMAMSWLSVEMATKLARLKFYLMKIGRAWRLVR